MLWGEPGLVRVLGHLLFARGEAGGGEETGGAEFFVDEGGNLAMDSLDGLVSFDDDDAVGLAGGNFAIFVVDAAVEGFVFALEASFVVLGGGIAVVATTGAAEGLVEIGKEQKGEVGLQAAAHGAVHLEDDFAAELTAAALVGFGGVSEAIAENDVAAVEGGRDAFGDAFGAVGKHEAELGLGREVVGLRVEQEAANAVADAGASGLAGNGDAEAECLEMSGQLAELRRFTGAVEAFEGEEEAIRHADRVQGDWPSRRTRLAPQ